MVVSLYYLRFKDEGQGTSALVAIFLYYPNLRMKGLMTISLYSEDFMMESILGIPKLGEYKFFIIFCYQSFCTRIVRCDPNSFVSLFLCL